MFLGNSDGVQFRFIPSVTVAIKFSCKAEAAFAAGRSRARMNQITQARRWIKNAKEERISIALKKMTLAKSPPVLPPTVFFFLPVPLFLLSRCDSLFLHGSARSSFVRPSILFRHSHFPCPFRLVSSRFVSFRFVSFRRALSFYFARLSFNDPPPAAPFRPFRINVSPRIRK